MQFDVPDSVFPSDRAELMALNVAGRGLVWQDWGDLYIVYQPSSTETHIFNETTALILKCLEGGPMSADELKGQTEASLGVGPGELASDNFAFAKMRLEELGLIERLDDANAVQ